jgi:3',5'-cyclic AMP phosphodiesterase CpdA
MQINNIKYILITLFLIGNVVLPQAGDLQSESVMPQDSAALAEFEDVFTFMIASDLGRNGYYDQKPIAEMMGVVARIAEPEFVAALGDVHHFHGVQSTEDPLWQTNYEWIYKHPELMILWHPVLGNHEYRGNTQAVIDYSNISRRWEMPARYYAITETISDSVDALLLFIDTPLLIDKYRNDPEVHADAEKQSIEKEIDWIDSTLSVSNAKWKIVMGHHPIYAGTYKSESERTDLQERLLPVLEKNNVDVSVCGHLHNFQHLHKPGSKIDYFVNSSASQTRDVDAFEGQLFGSSDSGFTLCTVNDNELIIAFVNKEGEIIYKYSRKK